MSPCGIAGAAAGLSSGMSVISASVVSRREAIDAAFCSATRSTLVGSMIPAWTMSTYSMLSASKPRLGTDSLLIFSTITLPSRPAFSTIWRIGSSSARLTIMAPTFSSPSAFTRSTALDARSRATPPPGTMPSSTAARVAFSASSTQPLLQLLAVVVRRRFLDLGPDLLDAPLDFLRLAGALDDRRVVLVDDHLLGLPKVLELDVLELDPEVLRDRLAAGQSGDVLEHGFATVAEAWRLHRGRVQRAAQLIDDERGQRLALDVLGDDEEGLADPGDLLQQREHVLHHADLLLVDED